MYHRLTLLLQAFLAALTPDAALYLCDPRRSPYGYWTFLGTIYCTLLMKHVVDFTLNVYINIIE